MTFQHRATNAITMALLSVLALIPLASAYDAGTFWVAAGGGVFLGVGIAVLGARMRWNALGMLAAGAVTYFVCGGALAFREDALGGVIPTLAVLQSLAVGAIQVWKQALTLQAPFVGYAGLTVAPYFSGLLTSMLATSCALRWRRFGFALLPIGALLLFSVYYSTYNPALPALVGAVLAGVSVWWAAWKINAQRLLDNGDRTLHTPQSTKAWHRRVAVHAPVSTLVLGLVALSAVGVAALPLDRYTARDHITPPWQLHDYPTPLTSFRKWVSEGEAVTLFTVEGLPADATLRLAALDLYDGIVYRVSGAGGEGSGQFLRMGRFIDNAADGTPAQVSIEVDELTGIWLPTTGALNALQLTTAGSTRQSELYYNAATSTGVLTSGLASGDRYMFSTVIPARPTAKQLAESTIASIQLPPPSKVPDSLVSALDDIVAHADTPTRQVLAVETFLQQGYFSHGLEGEVASRSGHGVGREAELFQGAQMTGDDEQYAVAMALLLAQLGIPSRVVMGFSGEGGAGLTSTGEATVTGDQLHVWVEVPFEDLGWVAFWPTPSEDRVPMDEVPDQQKPPPRAQVAQPPDTPQEPAELPPPPPVEDSSEHDDVQGRPQVWAVVRIAGLSLLALAVICGPSLTLGAIKSRERNRRRHHHNPAVRAHGGWAELLDTTTDMGLSLPQGSTRLEHATLLDQAYPAAGTLALALRADAATFSGEAPHPDEVEAIWNDSRAAQMSIRAAQPWHRRWRARLLPMSAIQVMRRHHTD